MDRRNFYKNQNHKRNNKRNDDSVKEEMEEMIEEFKEIFVKEREARSSHTVQKEAHPNVANKIVKSLIVCEPSYLH